MKLEKEYSSFNYEKRGDSTIFSILCPFCGKITSTTSDSLLLGKSCWGCGSFHFNNGKTVLFT